MSNQMKRWQARRTDKRNLRTRAMLSNRAEFASRNEALSLFRTNGQVNL